MEMRNWILAFVLLLSCFVTDAQRRGSLIRIDRTISVACVDDYIEYCYYRQYKDNWCWAACIQMVLDYHGIYVSQSKIVERAYGGLYDFTANKNDIIDAIDGWSVNNTRIRASSERYKNPQTLINAIAGGTPLIIGLNEDYTATGHAYVLSHIFFSQDNYGNMIPERVVVVNPANDGDMEESLEWLDFYKRINTIITISIY